MSVDRTERDKKTSEHWRGVYDGKEDIFAVSWYQERPSLSLEFFDRIEQLAGAKKGARVIDVGGGASKLAGCLLERGYTVAVNDLSENALDAAREAIADLPGANTVTWLPGNLLHLKPPADCYDIWHDRAVFHFMCAHEDVAAYLKVLKASLCVGGYLILATFALGGPEKCSGLPIVQYDSAKMASVLGDSFQLVHSQESLHSTPWNSEQAFCYSLFKRIKE